MPTSSYPTAACSISRDFSRSLPSSSASPIAQQLGLDMEQGPVGAVIRTDPMKETSMPGVFACGDAARLMASVALAVGDGNLAGAGLHRSLMFGTI